MRVVPRSCCVALLPRPYQLCTFSGPPPCAAVSGSRRLSSSCRRQARLPGGTSQATQARKTPQHPAGNGEEKVRPSTGGRGPLKIGRGASHREGSPEDSEQVASA